MSQFQTWTEVPLNFMQIYLTFSRMYSIAFFRVNFIAILKILETLIT